MVFRSTPEFLNEKTRMQSRSHPLHIVRVGCLQQKMPKNGFGTVSYRRNQVSNQVFCARDLVEILEIGPIQ